MDWHVTFLRPLTCPYLPEKPQLGGLWVTCWHPFKHAMVSLLAAPTCQPFPPQLCAHLSTQASKTPSVSLWVLTLHKDWYWWLFGGRSSKENSIYTHFIESNLFHLAVTLTFHRSPFHPRKIYLRNGRITLSPLLLGLKTSHQFVFLEIIVLHHYSCARCDKSDFLVEE